MVMICNPEQVRLKFICHGEVKGKQKIRSVARFGVCYRARVFLFSLFKLGIMVPVPSPCLISW